MCTQALFPHAGSCLFLGRCIASYFQWQKYIQPVRHITTEELSHHQLSNNSVIMDTNTLLNVQYFLVSIALYGFLDSVSP